MSKNSISAAAYLRVNTVLCVDQSGKKSRKKAFLSEEMEREWFEEGGVGSGTRAEICICQEI